MENLKASVEIQSFDYQKYIWQIQFEPMTILSSRKYTYNTTIDYITRTVIQRRTNTLSRKTKEKIRHISEKQYKELIEFSSIEKIRDFEHKSKNELHTVGCGYRDGWSLAYSYFTKEDPPRIDGRLSTIYRGNPIEEIAMWISKEFPFDGFGY